MILSYFVAVPITDKIIDVFLQQRNKDICKASPIGGIRYINTQRLYNDHNIVPMCLIFAVKLPIGNQLLQD